MQQNDGNEDCWYIRNANPMLKCITSIQSNNSVEENYTVNMDAEYSSITHSTTGWNTELYLNKTTSNDIVWSPHCIPINPTRCIDNYNTI